MFTVSTSNHLSADDRGSSRGGSVGSSGHTNQHFFLEIMRTKHGVWHMWIWYLGEPDEATHYR